MIKKIINRIKTDKERGARMSLIEELFYDFNRSRVQVYWMNFVRGIFFGFGTVLGGTLLVALVLGVLGYIAGWFPYIGHYIQQLTDAIQSSK